MVSRVKKAKMKPIPMIAVVMTKKGKIVDSFFVREQKFAVNTEKEAILYLEEYQDEKPNYDTIHWNYKGYPYKLTKKQITTLGKIQA